MRRFKNILLVLTDNDDEKILHRATNIIRANKGRLTLVRVLSKVPDKILSRLNSSYRIDINELAAVEFHKSMNQLLDPLREEGLNVHGRFLFGSPFLEIIRQVLRQDHDLVMTTAEEKGFPRTALFGSTTMHLLRECPCPVWVQKPTTRDTYSRIMAAVDPDTEDATRHGLNGKILDLSLSIAHDEQSELHVIHCWRLPMEGTLRARQEFAPDIVDSLVVAMRNEHKKQLQTLLDEQDFRGITPHVHLTKGKAGDLIPRKAVEEKIDLVVMGTVCRTGIAGFFIGNTAEKVLQEIDCSVLAIKPEGFETPVTLE
jgi:nucleotide-binding universal stress UspA family protein